MQIQLHQKRMTEKNNLIQHVVHGMQEKKGKNITVIDLKGTEGAICDYFVICEGKTPTQVSALAESIEAEVKKQTQESPIRVQGLRLAEWVGIDYGNVIVHVFLPDLRNFYNIDHLWADANIENIPNLD